MNILFDVMIFLAMNMPVLLRKTKHGQWLHCLIHPYKLILDELQASTDILIDRAKYNGQTAVIQYFLQNKFPVLLPQIENTNSVFTPDVLIGTDLTNEYNVLIGTGENSNYNVFIGTGLGSVSNYLPSFIVKVNTTPTPMELLKLQSYINTYKIYGSDYKITNILKTVTYYQNY